VHCRSVAQLAARRERALARGFLQHVPLGTRHVAVPQHVAQNARRVLRGLSLHHELQQLSGRRSHSLRMAILAAKEQLTDKEFREYIHENSCYGKAKHRIPLSAQRHAPPFAGGAVPSPPREALCLDELIPRSSPPCWTLPIIPIATCFDSDITQVASFIAELQEAKYSSSLSSCSPPGVCTSSSSSPEVWASTEHAAEVCGESLGWDIDFEFELRRFEERGAHDLDFGFPLPGVAAAPLRDSRGAVERVPDPQVVALEARLERLRRECDDAMRCLKAGLLDSVREFVEDAMGMHRTATTEALRSTTAPLLDTVTLLMSQLSQGVVASTSSALRLVGAEPHCDGIQRDGADLHDGVGVPACAAPRPDARAELLPGSADMHEQCDSLSTDEISLAARAALLPEGADLHEGGSDPVTDVLLPGAAHQLDSAALHERGGGPDSDESYGDVRADFQIDSDALDECGGDPACAALSPAACADHLLHHAGIRECVGDPAPEELPPDVLFCWCDDPAYAVRIARDADARPPGAVTLPAGYEKIDDVYDMDWTCLGHGGAALHVRAALPSGVVALHAGGCRGGAALPPESAGHQELAVALHEAPVEPRHGAPPPALRQSRGESALGELFIRCDMLPDSMESPAAHVASDWAIPGASFLRRAELLQLQRCSTALADLTDEVARQAVAHLRSAISLSTSGSCPAASIASRASGTSQVCRSICEASPSLHSLYEGSGFE